MRYAWNDTEYCKSNDPIDTALPDIPECALWNTIKSFTMKIERGKLQGKPLHLILAKRKFAKVSDENIIWEPAIIIDHMLQYRIEHNSCSDDQVPDDVIKQHMIIRYNPGRGRFEFWQLDLNDPTRVYMDCEYIMPECRTMDSLINFKQKKADEIFHMQLEETFKKMEIMYNMGYKGFLNLLRYSVLFRDAALSEFKNFAIECYKAGDFTYLSSEEEIGNPYLDKSDEEWNSMKSGSSKPLATIKSSSVVKPSVTVKGVILAHEGNSIPNDILRYEIEITNGTEKQRRTLDFSFNVKGIYGVQRTDENAISTDYHKAFSFDNTKDPFELLSDVFNYIEDMHMHAFGLIKDLYPNHEVTRKDFAGFVYAQYANLIYRHMFVPVHQ